MKVTCLKVEQAQFKQLEEAVKVTFQLRFVSTEKSIVTNYNLSIFCFFKKSGSILEQSTKDTAV